MKRIAVKSKGEKEKYTHLNLEFQRLARRDKKAFLRRDQMGKEVGGGIGWGTHVNPWLIHVNVWQKPLQYCKVISLQLIKINEKIKKNKNKTVKKKESSSGVCS